MSEGNATQPLISVVVPCFNEGRNLEAFHATLREVIDDCPGERFEIVYVNDGSSDDTSKRLADIGASDGRCRIIEFSRNFGKEAALTAGLDWARGDAVVPMDADLQHPPSLIPLMVKEWLNGHEVVCARRVSRDTDGVARRTVTEWFYALQNIVSSVPVPKDVGDFRMMDRVVVDSIKALPERQRFMKGLFAWVGFTIKHIDYTHAKRHSGSSTFSAWRLWNFALEGITSFSTFPLRVWTYVGMALSACTLAYGGYIALRTLIYGVDVPGYASLFTAMLFFGSLHMLSMGMLGEYVGRIYMEAKERPVYIVRRSYSGKFKERPRWPSARPMGGENEFLG